MTDTTETPQLPFTKPDGSFDWVECRFAFVNCNLTPLEFAQFHGLEEKYILIKRMIYEQRWHAERKIIQREIEAAAQAQLNKERAEELAEFNKADLTMAKSIRGMVAARLSQIRKQRDAVEAAGKEFEINANELRVLASTVESAQRVGRLALGLNTSSNEVTGPNGAPLQAPTIIIGGPGEPDEPGPSLEEVENKTEDGDGA